MITLRSSALPYADFVPNCLPLLLEQRLAGKFVESIPVRKTQRMKSRSPRQTRVRRSASRGGIGTMRAASALFPATAPGTVGNGRTLRQTDRPLRWQVICRRDSPPSGRQDSGVSCCEGGRPELLLRATYVRR